MRHNLKPEVAAKLCALLPTLKQTTRDGKRGECYCFEGAICELYRRETGEGQWIPVPDDADDAEQFAVGDKDSSCVGDLPAVAEWATVDGRGPMFNGDSAYILNDGVCGRRQWSFDDFVVALQSGPA